MSIEEIKKQTISTLVGTIIGAMITGAITLGTITVKIDKLANGFAEYKAYNSERYQDIKNELAALKNDFRTSKNQQ